MSKRFRIWPSFGLGFGNPYHALYRLLYNEPDSEAADAQLAYVAFGLAEGGYQLQYKYCNPYETFDASKCFASQFVIAASWDINAIPGRYCRRMMYEGVSQLDPDPVAYCGASDAVVPYQNQSLPRAFEYPIELVSHTEQTKSPLVLARIESFLRDQSCFRRVDLGLSLASRCDHLLEDRFCTLDRPNSSRSTYLIALRSDD